MTGGTGMPFSRSGIHGGGTICLRTNAKVAKQRFEEHYQHLRELLPRERLLEHRSRDGWEPFCRFLGHDVPIGEYPRAWAAKELVRGAIILWWMGAVKMFSRTALPVIVAIGVGVYLYRP